MQPDSRPPVKFVWIIGGVCPKTNAAGKIMQSFENMSYFISFVSSKNPFVYGSFQLTVTE
jgi:hypothetical protein